MTAPLPPNENARLTALHRYRILDTPPEPVYDDLTRLAADICRTPFAVMTLIDHERQWFKSTHGITIRETPRDIAFCTHAFLKPSELLIIPDMHHDRRFVDHPLVTGPPHIRFYAGAVLMTPDGFSLGTLCVLDQRPRHLRKAQIVALQTLSRQTVAHLELRLLGELRARQATLEETNRRLQALAATDGLTGLQNHRAFRETLRRQCAQAGRARQPLSLVMLDADHFKSYNDDFGHPAGDAALKQIAVILRRAVRGGDLIARYGGEEFAVVLPDTDGPQAFALAERLRRKIEEASWPRRRLTASFGVATQTPVTPAPDRLIQDADEALYRAKHSGRNRVCGFRAPSPSEAASPPP